MARSATRLVVTTIDQLASSLGNFVLIFSLAHTSTPHDFGIYTLGIAVISFALTLGRSVVSTPFTIDSVATAGSTRLGPAVSVARSSALALLLGSALAAAMAPFVAFAAISSREVVGVLALFMVALPMLMLQDFLRYVAIAQSRPRAALLSDGTWTGIVLGLFCYQIVTPDPADAWVCAAVWLLGLALGLVVLVAAGLADRPVTQGLVRWLRGDRRHLTLAGDAALMGGGPIVLTAIVAVVCGTDVVAALRGASTVFGPFNTLLAAATLALVPEVRRRRDAHGERVLIGATALICLGAIGFGLVMSLAIPDRVGEALLGRTWPLTHRILLATTAEYVGIALATGGVVWCRAKNRVDVALRLQVAQWVGLILVTTTTGLVFGTARAVAIGLAVVAVSVGAASMARAQRLPYE